jgi:hypothetical protein
MKRKFIGLASALALGIASLTSSGVHAATTSVPDEQWNLPMNAPDQEQAELIGLKIADPAAGLDEPSFLAGDQNGSGDQSQIYLCANEQDSKCTGAKEVNYRAYLPPCDATNTINCISDVSAINSDGKEITGSFSKFFPTVGADDYPGDPSKNLPVGSSPSVWTIPGVIHGGGADTYLLRFAVTGNSDSAGHFHADSIQAALFPVTTQSGGYSAPHMNDKFHPSDSCTQDNISQHCGFGSELGGNDQTLTAACVSFDVGLCALRQAFPDGYRFKVSARLGDSPTGWFHGRFLEPNVDLTANNGVTNLSIDASPVKVPVVGTFIKQSAMSPDMKTFYAAHPVGGTFGRKSANGIQNEISSPQPSEPTVFDEFALWSSYFKNTASATQSEWSFRTLQLDNQSGACLSDKSKLVGVVSTNAMMYSGGAPAFDKGSGALNYKVGAPHYASNGDVFKGTYDLQLRSDVARCLYGFSKAPISATISVTGADGSSEVATTVVGEANGWLHLSANNFEFSSPTIKVKLSQAGSPSVSPAKATQKTLTCVKGKVTKQVTTATCPSGYKKK